MKPTSWQAWLFVALIMGCSLTPLPAQQGKSAGEWVKLLTSEKVEERRQAAEALAKLGPAAKTAVADLAKALRDSDSKVRSWSASALGHIGAEAKAAVP